MPGSPMPPYGDIVLYQTEDGRTRVECRFADETLWLSQALIAELFQISLPTVNEHLKNIYDEGELASGPTIRKFRIVRREGAREVAREIEHYNLDAILAVGYRVRSNRGTQFRRWATERLREYLVKGFSMDDERLKNPPVEGSGVLDHFDEMLERIRDIRASERRMYLRVREIFALAASGAARTTTSTSAPSGTVASVSSTTTPFWIRPRMTIPSFSAEFRENTSLQLGRGLSTAETVFQKRSTHFQEQLQCGHSLSTAENRDLSKQDRLSILGRCREIKLCSWKCVTLDRPDPTRWYPAVRKSCIASNRENRMSYLPSIDRIRRIPTAMGLSPHDADDIAQQAALACLEYQHDHKRVPESDLEGTITRRRCADHFRARVRFRRLFGGHNDVANVPSVEFDPVKESERRDTDSFVREATASLPAHYSETLQLAYWEGLSETQIAQRLKVSEQCVRQRNHRAREILRPILQSGLDISPRRKYYL